jgi:alkanesulfonate monooxygenase SsuD/methylene tetrahydromethanopterin reductase-like flavin-dependent oxidoreductase (luciferase family)
MQLPAEVIQTDHNLEQIADKANGQLAKHRHHWTLDESNPRRVSIREYARQVGRDESTIRVMVNGYATYSDENTCGVNPAPDLQSHISRARMGAETRAVAEAVAKARGVGLGSVRDVRTKAHNEARRVREISRQLAEERGTSVEEEAPKVAETIVRHEQAQQAAEAEKLDRSDIRFVEMEGYLVKAKRELLRALKLAPAVPWDDESRELLTETVANIKALLALIDTAISGKSGVDWDAEFAKVAGDEIR